MRRWRLFIDDIETVPFFDGPGHAAVFAMSIFGVNDLKDWRREDDGGYRYEYFSPLLTIRDVTDEGIV